MAVVAKALESFALLSPESCISKLPTVLPIVSSYLSSESKDIYSSASQCLIAIVSQSIPDKFLLQPSPTNGITGEIYETVDDAITYISKMIEDILFFNKVSKCN